MSTERMPTAFVTSAAMHGAALALLMYTAQVTKNNTTHVIGNVDLLIQVKKPAAALPRPAQAAKATTFDFLKLALPSIPKVAAPALIAVKVPEAHRQVLPEIPQKIQERQRMAEAPKLEGLDLGRKSVDLAKIEAKVSSRRAAALAEAPKLEEVGRRQVKNLPQALALEERRQEAVALQALQPVIREDKRRQVTMSAAPALAEAAPPPDMGLKSRLARFLPAEQLAEAKPQAAPMMPSALKVPVAETKAPPRAKAEALGDGKKKGVELEGPIADRKVAAYEIPEFPAWAKEQGMIEASVAIKFWVSRDGDVLPNMRVEHTSGYGRLDRHAMESLKKWKFAPVFVEEKQWGVITFRFLLE